MATDKRPREGRLTTFRPLWRLAAPLFGAMVLGVLVGVPARAGVFTCDEAGILAAIAAGGGPHTFACAGPTTVISSAEIVIDNDVILDGERNLTVDGGDAHRVFSVSSGIIAVLERLVRTRPTKAPECSVLGGC